MAFWRSRAGDRRNSCLNRTVELDRGVLRFTPLGRQRAFQTFFVILLCHFPHRQFAGVQQCCHLELLDTSIPVLVQHEKNSIKGNNSGNSRNGYGHKTITSDYGESEIVVPRDRNGTFEPQVIAKRQTRSDEIESKVVSMYAKGMTMRDIEDTLREIYGAEVSASLISRITDKLLPEINEWQYRPLDAVYAVVFFDGVVFNTRLESKIIKKCVYSVLGIDTDGHKDILGYWMSENESASFWASVCADLKKRGML